MPVHLNPVGPLPAAVYWRRRSAVLLGVLLLLLLLTRCGGNNRPEALRQATPSSPSPSASAAAALPTAAASSGPSASAVAGAACTDGDLAVEAGTERESYPRGTRPVLRLSVRNTGATACTRPLGQGAVELTVFSGSDRIWSSDDCSPGGPPGPVTLKPQQVQAVTLTWAGRRSRPGCVGANEAVDPGTYRAVGRVGALRTSSSSFSLR